MKIIVPVLAFMVITLAVGAVAAYAQSVAPPRTTDDAPPPARAQAPAARCAKCNESLAPDAKFCPSCGTAVPKPPQERACAGCGHQQPSGNFCVECGKKFKDVVADLPRLPMPPSSPASDTKESETDKLADQVDALGKSADAKMEKGDYRGAALDYLEAMQVSHKLTELNPGVAKYKRSEYWNAGSVAIALDAMGDEAKALQMQKKSTDGYGELAAAQDATPDLKQRTARAFGSLAWYQLKSKDPVSAVASARKGLEFDPSNVMVKGVLAHSLLLSDQFEEAKAIYLKERATMLPGGGSLEENAIADFETFKKLGINHAGMEKILALFGASEPPAAAKQRELESMYKVVDAFLTLIDEGKYDESFEVTSDTFREGVTKKAWADNLIKHRVPLGKSTGRTCSKVDTNTDLQSGKVEYVFPVEVTFPQGAYIEDVTVIKTPEGAYKVSDYSSTRKAP